MNNRTLIIIKNAFIILKIILLMKNNADSEFGSYTNLKPAYYH